MASVRWVEPLLWLPLTSDFVETIELLNVVARTFILLSQTDQLDILVNPGPSVNLADKSLTQDLLNQSLKRNFLGRFVAARPSVECPPSNYFLPYGS
ncbi:MAG: hypothetical protein CMC97_01985 [Flavobacteriales bacterium]|nr:hypothetical protein [Flavobacteriales bacterium]